MQHGRQSGDFPPLSSEQAVLGVVGEVVGARPGWRVSQWYVRRTHYVVAVVETAHSAVRFVVKLVEPGRERPNRHLDAMAAIGQLVRTRTAVPIFDVLAVDVSCSRWPWEYLIVTDVPGLTWAALYPDLDRSSRAVGQRQIGAAAGQLHALRFDAFGPIGASGAVVNGTTALPALKRRALQRLKNPRYRDHMLEVLDTRAELFADLGIATLCHEDLNPNNLVFELRNGQPQLVGVLDFESAWASTGESDLARLELWRVTRGLAVREGYEAVASIDDGYAARKPILQLLWCLEYAEGNASPDHQPLTDQVCAEVGIAPILFG